MNATTQIQLSPERSSKRIPKVIPDRMAKLQMENLAFLSKVRNYKIHEFTDYPVPHLHRRIAANLGAISNEPESYLPVRREDEDWETDGFSSTARIILEDGTVGYFKDFYWNSQYEYDYTEHATSSVLAAVNEVNCHRLAVAMGGNFGRLVPKTVLRSVDGKIGSFQTEVKRAPGGKLAIGGEDAAIRDYRAASIFDFIVANTDRHSDNFIYQKSRAVPRLRLIDNSFTFPMHSGIYFNQSYFVFLKSVAGINLSSFELNFRPSDRAAIQRARAALLSWREEGTIMKSSADSALMRINYLLKKDRITSISDYYNR